jgi:hypothetical protein
MEGPVPFLYRARNTVVRDQAGVILQYEPLKDGRSRGDNGTGQECSNGIRDCDLKQQLRLRKEGTSGKIFGKTAELEAVKEIVGTSIRLRKMSVRTF